MQENPSSTENAVIAAERLEVMRKKCKLSRMCGQNIAVRIEGAIYTAAYIIVCYRDVLLETVRQSFSRVIEPASRLLEGLHCRRK